MKGPNKLIETEYQIFISQNNIFCKDKIENDEMIIIGKIALENLVALLQRSVVQKQAVTLIPSMV